MVVVALQEGLPILRGDGVALVIDEIKSALDDGKDDGIFLTDHARRMRRASDFEDHVTWLGDPAFIVGPGALNGVDHNGSRVEMHLERGSRMRADKEDDLAADGIQFDQLDIMALSPLDPGQILGAGMTGERPMSGVSCGSVAHGEPS